MLALTQHSHGDTQIDALPYYDGLTPEEKKEVNALIEEEMQRSSKRPADYLAELPPLPASRLQDDPIMAAELQRAEAGQPMAGLDTQRYNLDPPAASRRNDVSAWQAALANAHSQLEHQYSRLLNLELLLKFGPAAWRMHNEGLAAMTNDLQSQLADTRQQIDSLNRERKLQQTAAGREIGQLEQEHLALVLKNQEIDAACRQVEQAVAHLRGAAAAAAGNGSTEHEEAGAGAAAANGTTEEDGGATAME